jgi:hypothetical protein
VQFYTLRYICWPTTLDAVLQPLAYTKKYGTLLHRGLWMVALKSEKG